MLSKSEIVHSCSRMKNTKTNANSVASNSHNRTHFVRIGEYWIHIYTCIHRKSKFIVRSTDGHIDCVQLFSDSQLCSLLQLIQISKSFNKIGKSNIQSQIQVLFIFILEFRCLKRLLHFRRSESCKHSLSLSYGCFLFEQFVFFLFQSLDYCVFVYVVDDTNCEYFGLWQNQK